MWVVFWEDFHFHLSEKFLHKILTGVTLRSTDLIKVWYIIIIITVHFAINKFHLSLLDAIILIFFFTSYWSLGLALNKKYPSNQAHLILWFFCGSKKGQEAVIILFVLAFLLLVNFFWSVNTQIGDVINEFEELCQLQLIHSLVFFKAWKRIEFLDWFHKWLP